MKADGVGNEVKSREENGARRCEKMAALGTLTAGLMHELHNPGAAAARAGSLLRGNLLRLQELSLRFSQEARSAEQLECMHHLLEAALHPASAVALSSVEQADAEDEMTLWLNQCGVENALQIGPALVAIGFRQAELECARRSFDGSGFSDTLNWLEALISSATLVTAIEESITRISGLARSVKEFAHDDPDQTQAVNLHASLQSTLTLLGHKLRDRQLQVVKCFSAQPDTLEACGGALSQIWTNLLDNAIDASPTGGTLELCTWSEAGQDGHPGWLVVGVQDSGAGIPAEVLPHIFDEFYTTKPQGVGSGLGLPIVRRLVEEELGGRIEVDSRPGRTRFLVHLPRSSSSR